MGIFVLHVTNMEGSEDFSALAEEMTGVSGFVVKVKSDEYALAPASDSDIRR